LSGTGLLRKGGAIAAILFCIGVAIGPGLTNCIVSASSEKDLVEVAIEVCGVTGYRPYTVSLTKPQYDLLIRYLDGLMERLNGTRSQDDTILLFHEAVAELNTYGLLPRGMSVSQAQMLVRGQAQHSKMLSATEKSFMNRCREKHPQETYPVIRNSFCALFAAATKIPGYTPDPIIIPFGLLLVFGLIPALIVSVFGQEELATQLAELGLSLWMLNPLRWFNFVVFEGYDIEFRSVGMKGLVHETLNESGVFWGFTGLMLRPINDKTYFLGFSFSIYSSN
jgi:hypothetical protein